MRFLMVGAGALGGYYGGRLLEAGKDITFLVRPRRAAQLVEQGLVIRSLDFDDAHLANPPLVLAEDLNTPYDVILISCKAYDLPEVMDTIAPAVGPETKIIPMLNGLRHLDDLDARFGAERVLGGTCFISARLEPDGLIDQNSNIHLLAFGPRQPEQEAAAQAIFEAMQGVKFECRLSPDIVQSMWEKWVFLATLAGITCLNRAAIGDIMTVGGKDLTELLLSECCAIAEASERAPRPDYLAKVAPRLVEPNSPFTASMLSDLEAGKPTEADHILGDLLARKPAVTPNYSLLRIAYTSLKAQEARKQREAQ